MGVGILIIGVAIGVFGIACKDVVDVVTVTYGVENK